MKDSTIVTACEEILTISLKLAIWSNWNKLFKYKMYCYSNKVVFCVVFWVFLKNLYFYISSRIRYREQSHEKVPIKGVRKEQNKGDKSAAAAENNLRV